MKFRVIAEGDTASNVLRAVQLEKEAAAEGALYGRRLLSYPASTWRRRMRADIHYRSYGTLKYLLGCARERFERHPQEAYEITSAVLAFVDKARGPSSLHEIGLRALAWKEHANAVQSVGDLREALDAVHRSLAIYGENPTLEFLQTMARLVACNIHRDLGENAQALTIARECAEVLDKYNQPWASAVARLCEGHALFAQKQFGEALAIFAGLVEKAEREGDTLTLARALLNAAESARELGDIPAARDLYPRALAHFEALNLPTETTRVRWGHALSLADEGRIAHAVSELFKVRALYLSFGMNTHAATASLDIVRIRFNEGQDVRDLCRDLVTTFAEAGLTQSAIEALAYLREQAAQQTMTTRKIMHVRAYFDELGTHPALLFAPPWSEEEGRA